ncbi:MAG: glycoside hydrolase N-terminal domain-containing protein [Bacteroidetes bacterium]|nr:glycoside hydrolase N-terminal domain-containing protein [Bacteroidota bacterium]
MLKSRLILLCFWGIFLVPEKAKVQPSSRYNLTFDHLAKRWDEAMPLGNGMLGALIWEKNKKLRISLDRADLWDERMAIDTNSFNYKDVMRWVLNKTYDSAFLLCYNFYETVPYPTKLPAAALEFNLEKTGHIISNELDIATAINTIKFSSGIVFKCYVHATKNVGYFSLENLPVQSEQKMIEIFAPQLVEHHFNAAEKKTDKKEGIDLESLGYAEPTTQRTTNSVTYHQPTANGHFFEIDLQWKILPGNRMTGTWIIEKDKSVMQPVLNAKRETADLNLHKRWWKAFWAKSTVTVPDTVIQKQYFMEMYKMGASSRPSAPAIALQGIWTADDGGLAPWKGDFHNDLNTQLCYWPVYTSNHLTEGESYINWLWSCKKNNEDFTKRTFGVDGLNIPGAATITGLPVGGAVEYVVGPTVSAWCAQHFYWQWKYSMDKKFLNQKAYPYLHDAAVFIENLSYLKNGKRYLPMGTSPEYLNPAGGGFSGWFFNWTNFDLSLSKFLFAAAAELATACHKQDEAAHWNSVLSQFPGYDIDQTGLTIAPEVPQQEPHRHLSNLMAIYPLALLDINNPKDQQVIQRSINNIEKLGTRPWTGFTFAWMASLYARAGEAEKAVEQLRIFATAFVSPNSFHLNGDQSGGKYSDLHYRPFTLEGNFAFAQGVHELLLQSKSGYIQVFPAVPANWANVSFKNLRTEGAFIVSAKIENAMHTNVEVKSEKGGLLHIKLPFKKWITKHMPLSKISESEDGIVSVLMQKGQTIIFEKSL